MQEKRNVVDAQSPEWPSDWMRAVLGLLTLQSLEPGPSYGYAIIADLEANGMGSVKGGTLYPLLTRYEAAGLVGVEWRPGTTGPGRKYFSLTPLGHSELERMRADWLLFARSTSDYLDSTKMRKEGRS
ncbi:PadR family transcriptional regulator [Leucobacter sp. UCMA 4100]|uniref:PadR family transcriptional regulator n=1 Tax=Leucobacter sp. UCMA 4100 TaxID=2810534 RepID=UPI0022EABC96|nr:PadR family transcriptional regulator [Leucobacter sp. UCMA 4100]MDA3148166.1 PadR family transcriptional regulator [Leucobacter sp. UCMA 4100]